MRRATGCVRRMSCASPPRTPLASACSCCSARRTPRDRTTCSRRRAGRGDAAVGGIEFAALAQMWDTLKIDKESKAAATGYLRFHPCAARSRCDAQTAARLDSLWHSCARRGRPSPAKACLGPRPPPHLRGATSRSSTCSAGCAPPPARPCPSSLQGTRAPGLPGRRLRRPHSSSCTPSGTRAMTSRRRTRRSAARHRRRCRRLHRRRVERPSVRRRRVVRRRRSPSCSPLGAVTCGRSRISIRSLSAARSPRATSPRSSSTSPPSAELAAMPTKRTSEPLRILIAPAAALRSMGSDVRLPPLLTGCCRRGIELGVQQVARGSHHRCRLVAVPASATTRYTSAVPRPQRVRRVCAACVALRTASRRALRAAGTQLAPRWRRSAGGRPPISASRWTPLAAARRRPRLSEAMQCVGRTSP